MTQDELLALIERTKREKWSFLDLKRKDLTKLPPEIGNLINLKDLDCSFNSISILPIEFANLINLQILDLTRNRLPKLFSNFARLSNLQELYLGHNQLTKLPAEFTRLLNLRELYIHRNQLTELPTGLSNLNNLQVLDLSYNQLTSLPVDFPNLANLYTLNLSGNQLSELPAGIHRFPAAKKIIVVPTDKPSSHLRGNHLVIDASLRFPPTEVLGLGSEAIRNFLKAADAGSEYVWQSKCLLVGEGGVGKTYLYNALNGRLDQPTESTIGIDIGSLDLPHPDKPDVTMRLNCWDFAGQDFNHPMHQFFFSDEALFLLVWNARQGWQAGKLTYWLDRIHIRAPQAKIILVATHIDQAHSDYPVATLRADYPQIVDTFAVSSVTGENIAELRESIRQRAATLPLMGTCWPQTWLNASQALDDLRQAGQTHTSRQEAYRLMHQHGLHSDEECAILIRWLHELGNVLNFAEEQAIKDYLILDAQWLTKRIGLVLRSDEVLTRKGVLSQTHLTTLWPQTDSHIRALLLHLMDKFDLAYLIPNDPHDRSLVVDRIPLDPPAYQADWQALADASEIRLRFQLDTLPPGVPTWFIARCHRFTMGLEGVHWLNGVLFKDEDDRHRALVIANPQQRTVEMAVRGPFPQRFMSLLRDGFRDTLKRYEGLTVERWIPCPGYNELDERPCSNQFRLDSLERWLEKRPDRDAFTCPECDTTHSRLRLVHGVGASSLTNPLTEERAEELLDKYHQATQQTIREDLTVALRNVIQYQEREFLRIYQREQQRDLFWCPNVFTIWPVEERGLIQAREWQVQLWCQEPGAWHPAGAPYKISERHAWVNRALPYLQKLLKVMQVVAPLAGAVSASLDVAGDKSAWAKAQHTIFENEVAAMGKWLGAVKALPSGDGQAGNLPGLRDLEGLSANVVADSGDLLVVRELMDVLAEMDEKAGRPKWAGLTRRQTPEGDIFWLDAEHLRKYESKRPRPGELED